MELFPQAPPNRPVQVVIDFTGTSEVSIAATEERIICVWRYRLFVGSGASLSFASRVGSTDTIIFPDVALSADGTVAYYADLTCPGGLWVPEFATETGGSLKIILGASARCRGTILFTFEKPTD